MQTKITIHNIRVYGLLINNLNQLLLVDEQMNELHFTKFPGGGLEHGEGIRDCLIREFKEETGIDIEIKSHLYTTDFFQQSMYRESDQIISIYYFVEAKSDWSKLRLDNFEIEVGSRIEKLQFKWVELSTLQETMFSLPIDKYVCRNFLENKLG